MFVQEEETGNLKVIEDGFSAIVKLTYNIYFVLFGLVSRRASFN